MPEAIKIAPAGESFISISSKQKLDQLTALRFFAAMLIVIHHCTGLFGFKVTGYSLDHGVSFFFVLSGFILTYVYPSIDTWRGRAVFWRARLARVWPVYIASFILGAFLLEWHLAINTTIANLFMLQAWIPMSNYYFSYNAVGWSISTELFFYLMFPLLIINFSQTWYLKLFVAFLLVLVTATICRIFLLKQYGDGTEGMLITQHALMYISPVSRIFEFVAGMSIAVLWQKTVKVRSAQKSKLYTGIELFVIGLCLASMYYVPFVSAWMMRSGYFSAALIEWVMHSGSVVTFAILIYVMSLGRGLISKILSSVTFVLLGEISFSMYLIHYTMLSYYRINITKFSNVNNFSALSIFMSVLIIGSYLMWSCIEMPVRKLIVGRHKIHGSTLTNRSWHAHIYRNKETVLAGVAMVCLVAYIRAEIRSASRPTDVAQTVRPASIPAGPTPSNSCFLDVVDNAMASAAVTAIANAEAAMLVGWAVDEKAGATPEALFVQLSGGSDAYIKAKRTKRPDVSEHFSNANMLNPGWTVSTDLSGLPRGEYVINVIQVDGSIATICHTGKSISLN